MAKKKQEDPPKGTPLWMNTFADLMNLLLCFFVMLFAMSSVDEQKFDLVAASFSETFSIFKGGASAIGDGMLISNGVSQLNELDSYINSTGRAAESDTTVPEELDDSDKKIEQAEETIQQAKVEASEELAGKVEEAVREQNLDKEVDIDVTSQYVQLTLQGALLFDSGSTVLKAESLPVLSKVGVMLERYAESTIEIEGHTDNVPMSGAKYSNNDELSSGRALSVFNYLIDNTNLDPAMVKHSGRGEYIPIADNSTPEGRALNRRVEIRIYNSLSAY